MWGRLLRVFDLRPGERRPVLQSALLLFLVIGAHTLLETARDALFLEKLPAHRLSLVYAAMAILSLAVVRVTERFVFRFGRRNAFIFTLMACAYGATLLYLAPSEASSIFLLYVFTGVCGTLLTLQFWLLAGSLFTVSQGKRLFGPLAAGGVLGAVTAASSAVLLLRFVGVRELIVVAAALLLIAASVLSTVAHQDDPRRTAATRRRDSHLRWDAFRSEPYVRRLAGFIVAITAAVLLTDYLFKWTAAAVIRKESLGSFFATYYAALNTASFVVQVLLSGYMVRRFGVLTAILVLPLLVTVGGLGSLLLGGGFLIVLLTKGADGSLRHSLHRVSTELLWMPVGLDHREVAKSVVDSVFVRLTQAATAGFILMVGMMGREDPRIYAGLLAIVAGLALGLGISLRRPYLDLFRTALGTRSPRRMDLELDLRSVEVVVEALSSREPTRVLAAIDLLEAKHRQRLIPALILYHDDESVLLRALRTIAVPERRDWVPLTERLLTHESEVVRAAAVRALAWAGGWSELVAARLLDISPVVRAHATYWRLEREVGAPAPERDDHVNRILQMEGEAGVRARMALLEAIADGANPSWMGVLLQLDWSGDAREIERAAMAVQKLPDPRFIPRLIPRLSVRAGRGAVRSAIQAHGEDAQAALESAFLDPTTDSRIRLHIPRSLAWFANQRAADFLVARLEQESDRRVAYKLLRALERLTRSSAVKVNAPRMEVELRRNLLRYFEVLALRDAMVAERNSWTGRAEKSGALLLDLIDDKLRQALERSLMVLGILYRHEDLRPVFAALQSESARTRAQAAELLDVLLQSSESEAGAVSRELVRLLADDLDDRQRLERVRTYLASGPKDAADALRSLMSDPREPQAALTAHHVFNLEIQDLKDDARRIASAHPGLMSEIVEDWDGQASERSTSDVG